MKSVENLIGQKVIVRSTNAGVFFGTLVEKEKQTVALKNARRLWFWSGAASLSQLALEGVKKPNDSKFTVALELMVIEEVIEILPCTKEAVENIEKVWIWKV